MRRRRPAGAEGARRAPGARPQPAPGLSVSEREGVCASAQKARSEGRGRGERRRAHALGPTVPYWNEAVSGAPASLARAPAAAQGWKNSPQVRRARGACPSGEGGARGSCWARFAACPPAREGFSRLLKFDAGDGEGGRAAAVEAASQPAKQAGRRSAALGEGARASERRALRSDVQAGAAAAAAAMPTPRAVGAPRARPRGPREARAAGGWGRLAGREGTPPGCLRPIAALTPGYVHEKFLSVGCRGRSPPPPAPVVRLRKTKKPPSPFPVIHFGVLKPWLAQHS